MYLLIDYDQMKVLGKHPNFSHLCEYGILVCSEASQVLPLSSWHLDHSYSDADLKTLYRNVTGNATGGMYVKEVLCNVLNFYFNTMPETQLDSSVADQAQYAIDNGLEGYCQFKKNSPIPTPVTEPEQGCTLPHQPVTEQQVASGQYVVTPAQPQQAAYKPPRESAGTTTSTKGETSTAPRASGTREQIYEVADSMWNEAGSPTDKSEILKLRKSIMDKLEGLGVKRNTSSNTLGKWYVDRVLNA